MEVHALRPLGDQPLGLLPFPGERRQQPFPHKMRNLQSKVPDDVWPEFKARGGGKDVLISL
jgi:hypothetical protein